MGRWNGPMLNGHLLELFITNMILYEWYFIIGVRCIVQLVELVELKVKKVESMIQILAI
jgi:hypothetical protein